MLRMLLDLLRDVVRPGPRFPCEHCGGNLVYGADVDPRPDGSAYVICHRCGESFIALRDRYPAPHA